MLEEREIVRHCDARVLRRARNIARADDAVFSRTCSYRAGDTPRSFVLARVSDGARGLAYDVRIAIDTCDEVISSYECTCAASVSESGMCKHAAAAALAFARRPESFKGFSPGASRASSEGIASVLKGARKLAAADAAVSAPASQTPSSRAVRLSVVLVMDGGTPTMRLRVRGAQGSYAVRDLGAFVQALRTGGTVEYGPSLSFVHRADAFDEASAALAGFVERAVGVRQSIAIQASAAFRSASASELALSEPEAAELLNLCSEGVELKVDDLRVIDHKPKAAAIKEGNPPVRIVFCEEPASSGGADGRVEGFSFRPEARVDVLRSSESLFVWYEGAFWRADSSFAETASILRTLCASTQVVHHLSAADTPAFCSLVLAELERHVTVVAPDSMRALAPEPVCIEVFLDYTCGMVTCRARARYGTECHDLLARAIVTGSLDSQGVPGRDWHAEKRAAQVLARWFPPADIEFSPRTDGDGGDAEGAACVARFSGRTRIGEFVTAGLADLRAAATVFTTSSFDGLVSKRHVRAVVGLSMRAGLINMSVSSEDLDRRELAAVLASHRERRRFHLLSDGTYLDLADQELDGADAFLSGLGVDPDALATGEVLLPAYRAFQADMLADGDDAVRIDDDVRTYLAGPKTSRGEVGHDVPESLCGVLRPYQEDGFFWLCGLADAGLGGILADEMGLGKSLQLISWLVDLKARSRHPGISLIVCPASLVYNWVNEFRTFAPELSVGTVVGSKDERATDIASLHRAIHDGLAPPHDVVITSYDLLKRDAAAYEGIVFSSVTLDEAHYIRNAGTLAARSVKSLSATHRFALTGTPVANRLAELWSILDFLMPGLLGTYAAFRDKFELPVMSGDADALGDLRALTSRFILRRLKSEVASELPAKSVHTVFSVLTGEQRTLYAAREQALRESLSGGLPSHGEAVPSRNRVEVLAEITRLRELACDPRLVYDDFDGPSAKLDTIVALVLTARDAGKKSLVFSQFTRYLDLIASELDGHGVGYFTITGDTPKKRRVELVDTFNADDTPTFLISLKAGGTGLNLTGATVVIHADPWWNAAAEDQATDRAHRIGQTHDVDVYKVIAKDTIEDRVVALQQAKGELARHLVDADGPAAALTDEDLLALLGE